MIDDANNKRIIKVISRTTYIFLRILFSLSKLLYVDRTCTYKVKWLLFSKQKKKVRWVYVVNCECGLRKILFRFSKHILYLFVEDATLSLEFLV